jgi:NADH-quinone oxidoreductase E subunit
MSGSSDVTSPPALPAELHARIEDLRSRYPTTEALLLPVLHLAQRHWGGWLPDEAIAAVADARDLAPAKVYGVVTFYDLFHQQPVGRHRLRVCTNLPCRLRGAESILETLREQLGVDENEVTPDGRCSYVGFECLGACDIAPMAMIDDDYVGPLDPGKIRALVERLD